MINLQEKFEDIFQPSKDIDQRKEDKEMLELVGEIAYKSLSKAIKTITAPISLGKSVHKPYTQLRGYYNYYIIGSTIPPDAAREAFIYWENKLERTLKSKLQ